MIAKVVFSILLMFLSTSKALATSQVPDYLVFGEDTVAIFNNPLNQYFEKSKNKNFINFDARTQSTSCWRGYIAYWTLENDSLFLTGITSCFKSDDNSSRADLLSEFGSKRPFAWWYNGRLKIPRGELFSGADMGYNAIYEFEEQIQIENGKKTAKKMASNIELIEQIKRRNSLNSEVIGLKDTLFYYFKKNIDWEKNDESNFDCADSFILSYDKKGQLKNVELIKLLEDSDPLSYKIYEWALDKTCTRKIKKAIKSLSLSYLEPYEEFKIEIELFYLHSLEFWECKPYYKPLSDKEIEDYVRDQMDNTK